MSCGNPYQVPWSEVLRQVCFYLDGGLGQMGYAKMRLPGYDTGFKHPEGPRFVDRLNVEGAGKPASPRTAGAHRAVGAQK